MTQGLYKILLVAGYHVREAKFGRDVIHLFETQYTMPNVFSYNVEDNKGCAGGKRYKKVDKQIESKIAEFEPDLVIDIHAGIKKSKTQLKTEKAEIWFCINDLLMRDPADYAWFANYSQKKGYTHSYIDPFDIKKGHTTQIALEVLLDSLNTPYFSSEVYSQDIEIAAGCIKDAIESYRNFRNKLLDSDFKKKVAESLKKSHVPWKEIHKEISRIRKKIRKEGRPPKDFKGTF